MKFARRRAAAAPETPEAPDAPEIPPPPTPPPGSPVAAYAGILDGRTLWLAIEAVAGSLALRPTGGVDVIAVRSDLAEDQPAYRSIRIDLGDLGGEDPASYDVVLVPPGGGNAKPVWSHPLAQGGPITVPPGPDGRTQHALARTDDGFLQIRRRRLEPASELRRIELLDGGIELTVARVPDAEPTLVLLDQESAAVASYPLEDVEAGWRAVVASDDLPVGTGVMLRVGVGTGDAWVPVRRRHNDLANANAAVLLPQVYDDESDRPRLRPRWAAGALLQLRLPKAGPADGEPDAEPEEEDA